MIQKLIQQAFSAQAEIHHGINNPESRRSKRETDNKIKELFLRCY